jgi:hypothetical protein
MSVLQDLGLRNVLDINGRHRRLDAHCFLDRAHFHFSINGNGHVGRHRDIVLQCAETRQSEGHRVKAGPDVNNGVTSILVGDFGARSFDQRLASRFNLHARQDGTARVSHNA